MEQEVLPEARRVGGHARRTGRATWLLVPTELVRALEPQLRKDVLLLTIGKGPRDEAHQLIPGQGLVMAPLLLEVPCGHGP